MSYSTLQELYSDKTRWIKGCLAMTENSRVVNANDPEATRWCLLGGIQKVYGEEEGKIFPRFWNLGISDIMSWNDHSSRTVEDVQKIVKKLNV